MACGGPSREFSVIKSQEAFDDIMRMLKDKYYVERPDENWGHVKWRDDWDADEKILRDALTELFWTSDMSNF